MKKTRHLRSAYFEVICWLYALLFIYAAVSKLLEFENFTVQLGQSPLVSAFAGILSITVPAIELLIAVLLLFGRWQVTALYAGYALMVIFTAYIFIILQFSSYIPCSCGGILEKLGWIEHLWFNTVFVALAMTAILIHSPKPIRHVAH